MSRKKRRLKLSQTCKVVKILKLDWMKIQAFRVLFPETDTIDIRVDKETGTMAIPIHIAREIVKHHCL